MAIVENPGAGVSGPSSMSKPLLLSEKENHILELHDRLRELGLEIELFKARNAQLESGLHPATGQDLNSAQAQFLRSRASYMLRNDVIDSVMTVDPIIKAVYEATDASPIERDLLLYIEQRDTASGTIAQQDLELRSVAAELTEIQIENIRTSRHNALLAAEVLRLAEAMERANSSPLDDPNVDEDISRLQAQVKASRQRWKIMKGTASAIVAGSGVDWASDPELRDIVLDPD